jgi:hypothetical protein
LKSIKTHAPGYLKEKLSEKHREFEFENAEGIFFPNRPHSHPQTEKIKETHHIEGKSAGKLETERDEEVNAEPDQLFRTCPVSISFFEIFWMRESIFEDLAKIPSTI